MILILSNLFLHKLTSPCDFLFSKLLIRLVTIISHIEPALHCWNQFYHVILCNSSIYCWILFANNLYLSVILFCCNVLVKFWYQGSTVFKKKKKLEVFPSIFWKSLCNIDIIPSLNILLNLPVKPSRLGSF